MLERHRLYRTLPEMTSLNQWRDQRHAKCFANMLTGLIHSMRVSLTAWVPYAVDKALQAQSRQRRFRRFPGNERVEAHRASAPIITEALRSLPLPKLSLALDTTRLWEGHTRISPSSTAARFPWPGRPCLIAAA